MHLGIFVTHEIQTGNWEENRLRTETQKATGIDYRLCGLAGFVKMRHIADMAILGAVYVRAIGGLGIQFVGAKGGVFGMAHW